MERIDKMLLYPFLALVFLSCVMVFSAGITINAGPGFVNLFIKHLVILLISVGFLITGLLVPLEYWQKIVYLLLLLSTLLLILVLVPGMSSAVKGAKRWFRLPFGLSLQPSFICKWVLVIYMATSLSRKGPEKLRSFRKGLLPYIIILGILGLLFLGEPDFGGFFVMVTMSMIMLFIAGTKLIYWIMMVGLASPVIWYVATFQPYRLNRILAFTDVWKYSTTHSYQIVQSLYSFAAGGLTGVGPGMGRQKLAFLPEAHTDFIFSVIGEELGFVGTLFVVVCFMVITVRGFYLSIKLRADDYLSYLACGLTLFISFEALVNMLVSVSMAPPKGLPLPFLSYGGSAMIVYFTSMGILMNLSRRTARC